MVHKKIIAVLAALAIAGSAAGCAKKAPEQSGSAPFSEPPFESSFETEAPVASTDKQVVGKVTSIDGTKITIEFGELKQKTPSRDGNGGNGGNRKSRSGDGDNGDGQRRERPSRNGNGDGQNRERPSRNGNGDGQNRQRPSGMFGYTFNATSGSGTYDLAGLKEITLENDSDDTADTIDEIKTGDVVVITLNSDGTAASLTVKDLNGRAGNRRPGNRSSKNDENQADADA